MTPQGGYGRADDVLRWFRGWQNEMLSELGGMIAGVQTATGADDVEIAPGVRMRINPDYLAKLKADESGLGLGETPGQVDPRSLPYPRDGTADAISARGGKWALDKFPEALDVGTAQFPEGFKRRGGHVKDSEGVLALHQDRLAFLADSGYFREIPYADIAGYSVKRGLVMWKLILDARDGSRLTFKVGSMVAENAGYILREKGIVASGGRRA